jgi:hypothetical protein
VNQERGTGTLSATPSPVSFYYQKLRSLPADVQLTVGSSGAAALSFTASVATTTGGNWLSVTNPSGTTPTLINVHANPAGLDPGTYQGSITITAAGATNGPVTIPVTLTVTAALVLSAVPNSLNFSFQQFGPQPAVQTARVTTSGTALDSLDYTIVNDPQALWLIASGPGPAPATVTFSINTSGLLPGTYHGTITLQAPAAGNPSTGYSGDTDRFGRAGDYCLACVVIGRLPATGSPSGHRSPGRGQQRRQFLLFGGHRFR